MSEQKKVRILILCTGNSARSQMAEGLLRSMLGDLAEVHSAGVNPATEIHPLARRVMAEQGIDLAGQYPKHVDNFAGQNFDIILTVCDHARETCPFFPGAAYSIHWSLPDPAQVEGNEEERLEAFRLVVRELMVRVHEIEALVNSLVRRYEKGRGS